MQKFGTSALTQDFNKDKYFDKYFRFLARNGKTYFINIDKTNDDRLIRATIFHAALENLELQYKKQKKEKDFYKLLIDKGFIDSTFLTFGEKENIMKAIGVFIAMPIILSFVFIAYMFPIIPFIITPIVLGLVVFISSMIVRSILHFKEIKQKQIIRKKLSGEEISLKDLLEKFDGADRTYLKEEYKHLYMDYLYDSREILFKTGVSHAYTIRARMSPIPRDFQLILPVDMPTGMPPCTPQRRQRRASI